MTDVFPTNRGKTAQILRAKGTAGRFIQEPPAAIDTVALVFPIRDFDAVGAAISVPEPDDQGRQGARYRRTLPGGGFMATGVGDVAWIEGSLPKRVSEGSNIEGLPLPVGLDALRDMYDEAVQFCEPLRSFDRARVSRLDLVRDFDGVSNFPLWANGVRGVKKAGRARTVLWHDNTERGGALTLAVGPKTSWRSTMYDKHFESGGVAPPGRVRFEARCRTELFESLWARRLTGFCPVRGERLRVANLSDKTAERRLQLLTRGMFDRGCFNREVNVMGSLVRRIQDLEGLSEIEKTTLIGYVVRQGLGLEGLSRNTELKYRRMLERTGMAIPPDLIQTEDPADSWTVRLDYDAGTERIAVAA